ncbi:MAG: hypothetical protein ACKO85_15895, partial [Isosphaeraceae bacterium]
MAFAVMISQANSVATAQEAPLKGVFSKITSKFQREETGRNMLRASGLGQGLGQVPDDSEVKKVLFQDSPPAPGGLSIPVSPGPGNVELALPAAE